MYLSSAFTFVKQQMLTYACLCINLHLLHKVFASRVCQMRLTCAQPEAKQFGRTDNQLLIRENNMKLNLKKTGLGIAISAALLLTVAFVAFSQDPQGPPGPHRGGGDFRGGRGPGGRGGDGLGPLGRDLNLTDEQKAQIKTIRESFEAGTKELHEQMRALHEKEADPFTATFNEAEVRAAAEARAKIDVELAVARAKMMSQIGGVLTAEQKTQLASRRNERRPPPPPPGE
jgi:periplasmic protein CpxP/Spy